MHQAVKKPPALDSSIVRACHSKDDMLPLGFITSFLPGCAVLQQYGNIPQSHRKQALEHPNLRRYAIHLDLVLKILRQSLTNLCGHHAHMMHTTPTSIQHCGEIFRLWICLLLPSLAHPRLCPNQGMFASTASLAAVYPTIFWPFTSICKQSARSIPEENDDESHSMRSRHC